MLFRFSDRRQAEAGQHAEYLTNVLGSTLLDVSAGPVLRNLPFSRYCVGRNASASRCTGAPVLSRMWQASIACRPRCVCLTASGRTRDESLPDVRFRKLRIVEESRVEMVSASLDAHENLLLAAGSSTHTSGPLVPRPRSRRTMSWALPWRLKGRS